jgi:hypothetical protein
LLGVIDSKEEQEIIKILSENAKGKIFASLEEFSEHGIGYVIMKDHEIIAGASSYSYCKGAIEITI